MTVEIVTHDIEMPRDQAAKSALQMESDTRRIELLLELAQKDGENVRALARVAEANERRLDSIEG